MLPVHCLQPNRYKKFSPRLINPNFTLIFGFSIAKSMVVQDSDTDVMKSRPNDKELQEMCATLRTLLQGKISISILPRIMGFLCQSSLVIL